MSARGEVLVAIMNDPRDMEIAREEHWYRIPVASVNKFLKEHWPPQWLAFYQTQVFGDEAYAVNYVAQVLDQIKVARRDLFPEEAEGKKTGNHYWKLVLAPLERLPQPILSRRWRRIVFIPTTRDKLDHAVEINDLYDESPLEDRLWAELKRQQLAAERQEFVTVQRQLYALDFAFYCTHGKLVVETDGDTWHSNPGSSARDNLRANDLVTEGWDILRFNTHQIHEELETYCLPKIIANIERLGGLAVAEAPALYDAGELENWQQLTLFEWGKRRRVKRAKTRKGSSRGRKNEGGGKQLSLFKVEDA